MDDWFDAQTEIFFRRYQRECREYILNPEARFVGPVEIIAEASFTSCVRTGPITYRWDFIGLYSSTHTIKNMKSGEENEIRLIRYQILEP